MENLKELLNSLGISKVKLAKYLGVSRQMVYNYLELDSLDKWPKEKKLLILKLLNIDNGEKDTLSNIKINTDYLESIDNRLVTNNKNNYEMIDIKGLDKDQQLLLTDFTFLLKEKLTESTDKKNYYIVKYLYHLLQSIDNIDELKYLLGYVSKATGFIKPNEFAFNEDKQFMFEGIIHSAFTLYNSGGASKSRVIVSRERFLAEIDARNEERLGRTEQLNTIKIQALRELGYSEINTTNATEVLEKIAEIESRGV